MVPDPARQCVILGGGGHARVVIETLRASRCAMPMSVLDADPTLWGHELLGVPIIGGDELLPQVIRQGISHFVVGLGGVGDNRPRRQLFELGVANGLVPVTACHPSAVCSTWARMGVGSIVNAGSVVNVGVLIGVNVIVNTGAIIEHDCEIGDHAHVASGAVLSGHVRVGACAHLGAGAIVKQGVSIGEGAVVGAGAVVIRDVAPWAIVGGVPARPLKARAAPPDHLAAEASTRSKC